MTRINQREEFPNSKYPLYDFVQAHEEIERVACTVYYQSQARVELDDMMIYYDVVNMDDDYSYFGDRDGFLEHIHGILECDGDYYRSWINQAEKVHLINRALVVEFDNTIEVDVFDGNDPSDWPSDIISQNI